MADTPISVPAGRLELTDDSLKLLLHMDGADASTTFTDETGRTVTANGNAQIDDATYQFGGASGLFDGTADYLTTSSTSDLQATGDFTLEAWIRPDVNNRLQVIATKRPAAGTREYYLNVQASGVLNLTVWGTSGAIIVISGPTTVTTATWHHVAATKLGTTWYLFLDGALENSAVESAAYGTGTQAFTVGRDPSVTTRDFDGHIDELAVFFGRALYTSTFIPRSDPIAYTRPTITATTGSYNLTVDSGALSATGQAPDITRYITAPDGSHALTGQAVVVDVGIAGQKEPPAGAIAATGQDVSLGSGMPVAQATATITGSAPIPDISYAIGVGSGALTITGQDILAATPQFITGVAGAHTLAGQAVLPVVGVVTQPDAGAMTITGQAGTAPITWSFPAGSLSAAGSAPALYIGQYLNVGAGAHSFTGQAFGHKTGYAVSAGAATLTGQAPVVSKGVKITVAGAGSASFAGSAPSIPVIASPSYNVVNIEALF